MLDVFTTLVAAATAVFAIYDMFRIVQKISQVPVTGERQHQRRLGLDLRAQRRRPGDVGRDREVDAALAEAPGGRPAHGPGRAPTRDYCGGPEDSCTVAVWFWPEPSVQPMLTLSPG